MFWPTDCQGKEADIVFVIDMSSSIWSEFFKEQMVFVADLIDNFDIDSGKTQVNDKDNNILSNQSLVDCVEGKWEITCFDTAPTTGLA